MPENPPESAPQLTPDDLRRRFSKQSWDRYHDACDQAERIKKEAQTEVEQSYASLPYIGPRFDEYVSSGPPFDRIKRAHLKAARTILRALADAYNAAGISLQTFRDVIEQEIQTVARSLDVSESDRNDLRTELIYGELSPVSDELEPDEPSAAEEPDPIARERRALLESYQQECEQAGIKRPSHNELAAECGWSDRTHIARWLGNDQRSTAAHDRKIRKMLEAKPHLRG
jgi:hypothetical protein